MGRRALVFSLLSLVLTASAAAASTRPATTAGQSDGTFALQSGRGSFTLQGMQGSVLGRVDRGKVTITDPVVGDGTTIVRGYQWIKVRSATTIVYGGKNIRFRILGGRFSIQIDNGVGVDLSVVGRGRAMLLGAGYSELGLSDGQYSLNDGPLVPVPDVKTWLQIKAPPPKPVHPRRP